jgi:PPOX class probable F420-dependent enzyme
MATTAKRPFFTRMSDKLYLRLRHRDAWGSATAETVDPARGFETLGGSKYALLTTFRKSGEPVPTPVWFGVGDDGKLYVRSERDTGKVKRIRRDGRVRVAPSSFRGKPLGPPVEARARVLPAEEEERAEHAIQSNYGRFRRVYEGAGNRIGIDAVYIEIEPPSTA